MWVQLYIGLIAESNKDPHAVSKKYHACMHMHAWTRALLSGFIRGIRGFEIRKKLQIRNVSLLDQWLREFAQRYHPRGS
jgi:hypothetical protein